MQTADEERVERLIEKLVECCNLSDELGVDISETVTAACRLVIDKAGKLDDADLKMILKSYARPNTSIQ
jgi:hypothetical protein